MAWPCQTCTYVNINGRAERCHACGTARRIGSGAPSASAIVDLTEMCSPNPSDSNSNASREHSRLQRDGVMESNRSRRRRRQEKKSKKVNEREGSISADKTSNNSNGDAFFRRHVEVKGNSDGGFVTSMKNTNNSYASFVTSQTSQKSNKSSTKGEKNEGDSNFVGRKRKGEDENDDIIDPVPRRRPPLNLCEPSKRSESKLKRRKVDLKITSQEKNDNSKQRLRPDNSNQSGEPSSHENDSNKRTVAPSPDSKRRQHSSNKDVRTDKVDRSKPGQCLANYFNKKSELHVAEEDLLKRANFILQRTFNHTSLRPLQESAVKGALKKSSQIVIMATGGGKSICYQLPALVGGNIHVEDRAENSRVTIVVCPLIALMTDQVNNLHNKGIRTAACLSSSHSAKSKEEILNRLQTGGKKSQTNAKLIPIQLLYCTPELIHTEWFRAILTKLYESNRLYSFAIDEAHCLSTWGHDFRPAFRKLTWVRDAFPEIPFMACTGTATAKVIQDIRSILQFDKNVPCLMGTFNRENISYEVRFKDSLNATPGGAMADLVGVVKAQHDIAKKKNEPCSGIIYVHKREDCNSLAAKIGKGTGLVCLAYHAGLKDAERSETQRKWTDGTCSIAVATVAFGMGIDLPHVRYVIHWTMAKSLEGFYQESGRGGRDGKPALSILYYSKDDASKFAFLAKVNAERSAKKKGNQNGLVAQKMDNNLVELEGMVNYCTMPMCKRKYVLQHFGEKIDANAVCKKTCDYCISPKKVEREIQASECMSTVVNSHRLMHAGRTEQNHGKKYHHNPLADEESLEDDHGSDDFLGSDEGLLGFTDNAGDSTMISDPKKGFVRASSVLKKYEAKELEEGRKGGFVNFKTRTFNEPMQEDLDARRHRAISIPEHLRSSMPDPLAAHKKAPTTAAGMKTSSFYASDAERLKAELAELERQRKAALASMGGSVKTLSSRGASKSLPTPSLTFKRRR